LTIDYPVILIQLACFKECDTPMIELINVLLDIGL